MKKKLKIAYYCSSRSVFPPPKDIIAANAGIMFEIVRGMVRKGHDVTVYAPKGSAVKGMRMKIIDLGLPPHRLDPAYQFEEWVKDLHIGYRITYISELINNSDQYDLIHLHVGRVIFGEPFIRFSKCPVIFTIHESFVPSFRPLMNFFKQAKLVSVSDAQRKTFPSLNYIATIYHGIHVENYPFNQTPKDKYVFMSRVSKEKGVEFAIEVAQKAKISLDIYGPGEKNYLKNSVLPYVNQRISYHGMVKKYSPQWYKAYSEAKALILPLQWDEPFGLVLVEAMACGTPVIAFNRGSVPEVIKDGKTGFIVNSLDKKGRPNVEGLIRAVKDIDQIDRRECRKWVEEKFTVEKMVRNYEKAYFEVISDFKNASKKNKQEEVRE